MYAGSQWLWNGLDFQAFAIFWNIPTHFLLVYVPYFSFLIMRLILSLCFALYTLTIILIISDFILSFDFYILKSIIDFFPIILYSLVYLWMLFMFKFRVCYYQVIIHTQFFSAIISYILHNQKINNIIIYYFFLQQYFIYYYVVLLHIFSFCI